MPATVPIKIRAKPRKASFEAMVRIYQDWFQSDKTGTQAQVFKRQGWSRGEFFEEASTRGLDV